MSAYLSRFMGQLNWLFSNSLLLTAKCYCFVLFFVIRFAENACVVTALQFKREVKATEVKSK